MKFSNKDFFSNCDQIYRKLRIWSHLLKKSLIVYSVKQPERIILQSWTILELAGNAGNALYLFIAIHPFKIVAEQQKTWIKAVILTHKFKSVFQYRKISTSWKLQRLLKSDKFLIVTVWYRCFNFKSEKNLSFLNFLSIFRPGIKHCAKNEVFH